MCPTSVPETEVEVLAISYLEQQGYSYLYGHVISPDGESPERQSYEQVLLVERLRQALYRINKDVAAELNEQLIVEYYSR